MLLPLPSQIYCKRCSENLPLVKGLCQSRGLLLFIALGVDPGHSAGKSPLASLGKHGNHVLPCDIPQLRYWTAKLVYYILLILLIAVLT